MGRARECHIPFVGDWVLTFNFWLKIPPVISLPLNSFLLAQEKQRHSMKMKSGHGMISSGGYKTKTMTRPPAQPLLLRSSEGKYHAPPPAQSFLTIWV